MLKKLLKKLRSMVARNGAGRNGRTLLRQNATDRQVNGATATVPQGTTTLTQASQAERDAYWKTQSCTTAQEQMQEWERRMDTWLAGMNQDPATLEQYAFLQRLLGEDSNGKARAPVAVNAQALYNTFFLGEANGDIEYFFQRIVRTNTVEQIQRNQDFIENLVKMYGDESAIRALPRIAALATSHDHQNSQSPSQAAPVLGYDIRTGEEVCLSARSQAALAIGGTGTGKTTLMHNCITSDIAAGRGVLVIDPHGDLVRSVIGCMDAARLKDVILLDLDTASEAPFGLNPFETPEPRTVSIMASTAAFLSHAFSVLWGAGETTPRMMMVQRAVSRTCMENSPNATLTEVPLLFSDDSVRANLVANLTNSSIIEFWKEYNKRSPHQKNELVDSTRNKITAFTDEPMIRHIFGQSRTTIDFRSAMDTGKIVLVCLNPQFADASRLLSAVILAKVLMAAFSRTDTPPAHRSPFMVFADEWQTYMSADMARLLSESRKFNLNILLANQTLEMLDPANRAAALQVGTLISFRVSGTDSKIVARSYDASPKDPEVIGQQPLRAPVTDPISFLMHKSHPDKRVAAVAQTYLHALEHFLKTPTDSHAPKGWVVAYNYYGSLILYDQHVQQGRKMINESLYRCMSERNPHLRLPMLAIYLLACAQRDGREAVFSPYIIHVAEYFNGPYSLHDFAPSAAKFGKPEFIEEQQAASFIAAVVKSAKRAQRLKAQKLAEAVVSMLTELRYVLSALAENPLLTETGQYIPQYRQRSYADVEAECANLLSTLPNYTAKVRLLTGEHLIKTLPPPPLLPEHEVQARIATIKARMLAEGYTRDFRAVAEEIAKRHEHLRQRPHSDAPPPSSTTGRPPRRLRQKPPPAFT